MANRQPMKRKPTSKGRPPKLVPLRNHVDTWYDLITGDWLINDRWVDWSGSNGQVWCVDVDDRTGIAWTWCATE